MPLQRAIILIGVQNAEQMTPLNAVWTCVDAMAEWAAAQGIPADLIFRFTDEPDADGNPVKVSPAPIEEKISQLAGRGDLEQLIIYYSGHGINVSQNEFWVLSDARTNGNRAVNLALSRQAASYGPIPHVVFISDACRSAAQGIAQQMMQGSSIYPSQFVPGSERAVDVFYATTLGQPAMEIRSDAEAADEYTAVFTEAILEALRGQHAAVREQNGDEYFVRPRPLKKFLTNYVPQLVMQKLGMTDLRTQIPDANVASDDDVWLSVMSIDEDLPMSGTLGPGSDESRAINEAAATLSDLPELATRAAIANDAESVSRLLAEGKSIRAKHPLSGGALSEITSQFSVDIDRNLTPSVRGHFETGSGFVVKGASIRECVAFGADWEFANQERTHIRTSIPSDNNASSVLLVLDDGRGVVVPTIQGFVATLTFDKGQFVDTAYEPCDTTQRWSDYKDRAEHIHRLRAVAASASRQGRFQLEGPDAEEFAAAMQYEKSIDPGLSVYAAAAFQDQKRRERLQTMYHFQGRDLGMNLFEVALFAGHLTGETPESERHQIFPFVPLLSQTWAVLAFYGIKLLPERELIWAHTDPFSLWTLFDAEGVAMITESIQSGAVR